jgi:hypothetical protein
MAQNANLSILQMLQKRAGLSGVPRPVFSGEISNVDFASILTIQPPALKRLGMALGGFAHQSDGKKALYIVCFLLVCQSG